MSKITDCGICLDTLVRPKMLACQHTYCLECLRKLNGDGRIKCPECRYSHVLPFNGVDGIADNRTMVEVLCSLSTSHSAKKMPCQECKSGRDIKDLCEKCHRYLCEVCSKDHIQDVTDEIEIVTKELKDRASTIETEVEKMASREKKIKPLKKEIEKWEKMCVDEVHSKAKSLIAEAHSRSNIDQSWKEKAQSITNAIKRFEEYFTKPKRASKMSDILQENEILKILLEQSKLLPSTPQGATPQLKFDSTEAENVLPVIRKVKGVRELNKIELKEMAAKQLPAGTTRRRKRFDGVYISCLRFTKERFKNSIMSNDQAIASCEAGTPVDLDDLPSAVSECAIM